MPIRVAINAFGRAGEGGRLVRQRVGYSNRLVELAQLVAVPVAAAV